MSVCDYVLTVCCPWSLLYLLRPQPTTCTLTAWRVPLTCTQVFLFFHVHLLDESSGRWNLSSCPNLLQTGKYLLVCQTCPEHIQPPSSIGCCISVNACEMGGVVHETFRFMYMAAFRAFLLSQFTVRAPGSGTAAPTPPKLCFSMKITPTPGVCLSVSVFFFFLLMCAVNSDCWTNLYLAHYFSLLGLSLLTSSYVVADCLTHQVMDNTHFSQCLPPVGLCTTMLTITY